MTTKSKLVYCYWGNGIAVGIYGTKEEVTITANRLYNYKATDSDPIWISDNPEQAFAYVLSDFETLEQGYTDMFITGMTTQGKTEARRRLGHNLKKVCRVKAKARIAEMAREPFLEHRKTASFPYRVSMFDMNAED